MTDTARLVAALIWTGGALIGMAIAIRLTMFAVAERRKIGHAWGYEDGAVRTLTYLFRLALVGLLIEIALGLVGVLSMTLPQGHPVTRVVGLVVLLAMPFAVAWIVYRAFFLRFT